MHLGSLAGHEIGLNLPYAISLSCINTGVVHITAPDIFTKIQCNNSQFICLFCVISKDRALKALWSFIWFIGVHQWSDILRFLIKVGILNTLKIWKKKTLCVTEQKKTTQQFHRRIDPNVMDCLFSSWNSAKKKKSCIRFIEFYRVFWIKYIFLSLVPGNHLSDWPTIFLSNSWVQKKISDWCKVQLFWEDCAKLLCPSQKSWALTVIL